MEEYALLQLICLVKSIGPIQIISYEEFLWINHSLQHHCLKKSIVDLVSLKIIVSFVITLWKSDETSSGVLLRVIMHLIHALLAASTPKGAFSTTIQSDDFIFIFCNAKTNGVESGLPVSTSSPEIITSKFFIPIFLSIVSSVSFFAAPVTIAFKQLHLFKTLMRS